MRSATRAPAPHTSMRPAKTVAAASTTGPTVAWSRIAPATPQSAIPSVPDSRLAARVARVAPVPASGPAAAQRMASPPTPAGTMLAKKRLWRCQLPIWTQLKRRRWRSTTPHCIAVVRVTRAVRPTPAARQRTSASRRLSAARWRSTALTRRNRPSAVPTRRSSREPRSRRWSRCRRFTVLVPRVVVVTDPYVEGYREPAQPPTRTATMSAITTTSAQSAGAEPRVSSRWRARRAVSTSLRVIHQKRVRISSR